MVVTKKIHGAILALGICLVIAIGLAVHEMTLVQRLVNENASIGISFTCASIHTTITMTRNGEQVYYAYRAGAVTKLGMNLTLAKLTGNGTSAYNMTTYPLNLTFVSIGNMGTLNSDSTVLPGEWNRTVGAQHDVVYNGFNITAIIYPGAGPYTADCLGVNYESGIGNGALWGYDTFPEVTGIDGSFIITLEVQVTVS